MAPSKQDPTAALDVSSGWTASRLAKAAGGLKVRFVQEWLAQQAAAGLVDFDEPTQTFSLRRHRAACLAEELSGSFFAAYATLIFACYSRLPKMLAAFRGKCLAPTYDEAGDAVADAMARLHVPEFRFHLIPKLLPAVLEGRLQAHLQAGGAVCADIGCSGADCTLELAKLFPGSRFHAYEIAEPALERARANVARTCVGNLAVVDAKLQPVGRGPAGAGGKFDFVLCYDVLHDLSDPEALMREVCGVLAPEGVWLVVDITSFGAASENIKMHPGAGTYYGISVCLCLPSGLSAEGGKGLGTLGFPPQVAEDMFRRCGFSRVRAFKMPGLEKNTCFEVQI
uniref:Methyltransferase domain-containing protein n=1 Tax=Pyrodinium bahamense TaxID=73915 RepID=A0A7S0APL0_9DINO